MDRDRLMGQAMARGMSETEAAAAVDEYLAAKGGGKAKAEPKPKAEPKAEVKVTETVAQKPATKTEPAAVEKRATLEVKPREPGPKPTGAQAYIYDMGAMDIEAPKQAPTSPINDAARAFRSRLMEGSGASVDVAQQTVEKYLNDPKMMDAMREAMGPAAPKTNDQREMFVAYANFNPKASAGGSWAEAEQFRGPRYAPGYNTDGRAQVANLRREDERAGAYSRTGPGSVAQRFIGPAVAPAEPSRPASPTPAQMRAALEARYANDPAKLAALGTVKDDATLAAVYGRIVSQ